MRTLAIDLGTRRVGLALSDEGGRFATPYDVLTVASPAQSLELVAKVAVKEGVERIVIGLPINMDGSHGPGVRTTTDWGSKLSLGTGIRDVVYVDERLTSFEAEQALNQRKREGEHITRRLRKQKLDGLVAAGILQEFLDGKLPPLDV